MTYHKFGADLGHLEGLNDMGDIIPNFERVFNTEDIGLRPSSVFTFVNLPHYLAGLTYGDDAVAEVELPGKVSKEPQQQLGQRFSIL